MPAKSPKDDATFPKPGPAPVGPAVQVPPQQPADTPRDPGPAPVGPAVESDPDAKTGG
jgi:hypothetical protein